MAEMEGVFSGFIGILSVIWPLKNGHNLRKPKEFYSVPLRGESMPGPRDPDYLGVSKV